jgi:hypothetical protein
MPPQLWATITCTCTHLESSRDDRPSSMACTRPGSRGFKAAGAVDRAVWEMMSRASTRTYRDVHVKV